MAFKPKTAIRTSAASGVAAEQAGVGINSENTEELAKAFNAIESRRKSASKETKPENKEAVKDVTEVFREEYTSGSIPVNELKEANTEWNFFGEQNEEKLYSLAASIVDIGLLQPIVVREISGDKKYKYEILAGHTRVAAYRLLYNVYKEDRFLKINAYIFKRKDVDDLRAREIIIDTNYMQRGNLLPPVMARCIAEKASIMKEQKVKRISEKIAEQYHIKKTSVFKWQKIAKLSKDMLDYLGKNNISSNCMYIMAGFPQEVQEKVFQNCKEYLTNGNIMRLEGHAEDDYETVAGILTTKGVHEVITKRFDISSASIRRKTDKPALVFVEDGHLDELMKLLEESKYCYLVASGAHSRRKKK